MTSLISPVELCSDLKTTAYDGLVVVAPSTEQIPQIPEVKGPIDEMIKLDKGAIKGVFVVKSSLPCRRIIFSGTGPMDKDYEDIRSYAEAADKGVKKAISAGCKAPLLVFGCPNSKRFPKSDLVTVLGAMSSIYVTLELRESVPNRAKKVDKLGIFAKEEHFDNNFKLANALELGKIVCRDIGGSDPERTAAPRVEDYVSEAFKGSGVKIEVIKGQGIFEKEYPCLAAVNRAASVIPRHDGRVIWLTHEPEGKVEKTLFLVGKGITYDTGGADIKAGGIMAGMSRDKCGAASVAGIVKAFSVLKPKGIKVVGALCMVRNSVGENCYVSDEIITSRAGVRLRVGNTDAEGRMAMVDVLCHAKEMAINAVNPHLMTIATLTGHEVIAYGPYSAIMDNGPAKLEAFAQSVQATGENYGDMFEISTMRREDFAMIKDKSGEFVDVLQCNNAASSRTPRGHQFPGAFLQVVSGLDKHMTTAEKPLKYSHVDIAGSSGDLPGPTTASSVVAIVMNTIGN